jgi:hypothetical protein
MAHDLIKDRPKISGSLASYMYRSTPGCATLACIDPSLPLDAISIKYNFRECNETTHH